MFSTIPSSNPYNRNSYSKSLFSSYVWIRISKYQQTSFIAGLVISYLVIYSAEQESHPALIEVNIEIFHEQEVLL